MPHKPSDHDNARLLPAAHCPRCVWDRAGQPDVDWVETCPECHEPSFETLGDSVRFTRSNKHRDTRYAYGADEEAGQYLRRRAEENFQPVRAYAGSAEHDTPLFELFDIVDKAEAEHRERVRVERDKAARPHQPKQEWEMRSWSSMKLLAMPKWTFPLGTQVVRRELPEPVELTVVDLITGERYSNPRFTDNGCIALLNGEEHFLPAGSFETQRS